MLEQNIQQSLQAKAIDLDDAIDVRSINNVNLANTLLKVKKQRKEVLDMEKQKTAMQMQTQSNVQSSQAASQSRMQEEQMKAQTKSQLMQMEAQLESQRMQQQAEIDMKLLQMKYELEGKVKSAEVSAIKSRETVKEDRKDQRTKIQASQQSKLIEQRKKDLPAQEFEEEKENPNPANPMEAVKQMMAQKNIM